MPNGAARGERVRARTPVEVKYFPDGRRCPRLPTVARITSMSCSARGKKPLKGRQRAALTGAHFPSRSPPSPKPSAPPGRRTRQARFPFPKTGPELLLLSRGGGI
ncbi:hypothetical protein Stsp01_39740 [Streptomyces sp. NBRC 13847]|nr:hypothetical protein Stsp01_39740 [Streptomyces sp. NBRC 13847]